MMTVMNKKIIFLLLFVCSSQFSYAYHQALDIFLRAERKQKHHDYDVMTKMFSSLEKSHRLLLKSVKRDIRKFKSQIKRAKKLNFGTAYLDNKHQDLEKFYLYIKQHKHSYDAVKFHVHLFEKYQHALDNHHVVDHFLQDSSKFTRSDSKYKLFNFVNMIKSDLNKVSKFEDLLHGDFGVLKAKNYALKIELIKLRNHFLHHDAYKIQKKKRHKPFKSILFPATVVGAAGLAVYSVPYLMIAGFASFMTFFL